MSAQLGKKNDRLELEGDESLSVEEAYEREDLVGVTADLELA